MPLSRSRRIVIRLLLVAGTVLAIAAVFALWANRQVLNPTNWSETSSALLEDEAIRTQVSAFLVDEVYANTDVAGEIEKALPPRLEPLAGPAAGGLRTLAERTAVTALGRPRVQELWKVANRVTAEQFLRIVEGDARFLSINGNTLVLDLRTVMLDLVQRLGLPNAVADRIPPEAGRFEVVSADELSTAQNTVSAVRGLAVVLPVLAIGLLMLAVALAAGRRRRTMLYAGMCLVVAGTVVLVGRNIVGGMVVDALASTDGVRPAAENVWEIGTEMLRDIGQATIVLGIPPIFAALLASPIPPAVAVRRAMAPTLRHQPGVAYGVAAAVVLLIVAWGPIHATRLVLPVLLFFALTMLGVAALRRQTAEEFPDVPAGATARMAQERIVHAWRSMSAGRQQAEPAAAPAPAAAVGAASHLDQLERLTELHDKGALTDEEFAGEKSALLLTNGAPR